MVIPDDGRREIGIIGVPYFGQYECRCDRMLIARVDI